MRRGYQRQSASKRTETAKCASWRMSLNASLRAVKSRPTKDDLKKMFEDAARNTAAIRVEE